MLEALTSLGTMNLLSHGKLVSFTIYTVITSHSHHYGSNFGSFQRYSLFRSHLGSFRATVCMGQTGDLSTLVCMGQTGDLSILQFVWVNRGIFPYYSLYGSNWGSFHTTVCMGQTGDLSTM